MNKGYLKSRNKTECFGCESCVQVCPKSAISIQEDDEGFRYPVVDETLCIHCGLCNRVCPYENMPISYKEEKYVFGGYIQDAEVRDQSTSGGAFSAIADAWCDEDYAIFGAVADGLNVYHTYITNKEQIQCFRKSKYSQSRIGTAYADAKRFLKDGKKVLFSGTPCQIAGLKVFLQNTYQTRLLTVEVVCEGVPSPWYVRKYNEHCLKKYGLPIESLDYRYKDGKKWDFQVMETLLKGERRTSSFLYRAKWDFEIMLTKLRGGGTDEKG